MVDDDKPTPDEADATAARGYHHGDLRRQLVVWTLKLAEERGLDEVAVRDVAKAAGVSPGAPFRHFPTRVALLAAVAEQGMDALAAQLEAALVAAARENPLRRYRAMAVAYFTWGIRNPIYFQTFASRAVVDYAGPSLRERHEQAVGAMADEMKAALRLGLVRRGIAERYAIAGRALAYGIARLYIDGHYATLGLDENMAVREGEAVLDQFIESISR